MPCVLAVTDSLIMLPLWVETVVEWDETEPGWSTTCCTERSLCQVTQVSYVTRRKKAFKTDSQHFYHQVSAHDSTKKSDAIIVLLKIKSTTRAPIYALWAQVFAMS